MAPGSALSDDGRGGQSVPGCHLAAPPARAQNGAMTRRVTLTCPWGRTFPVTAARAASGPSTYCSKACQRVYPAARGPDHRSLPRDEPRDEPRAALAARFGDLGFDVAVQRWYPRVPTGSVVIDSETAARILDRLEARF